jgi:hypothetical protein
MSGDLHLHRDSNYDAGTGTFTDHWQVFIDAYAMTPLTDRAGVQERLRRFAEEAIELADSLEKK